ncbi:MAG: cell division protein ZapA [Pseudomonadota bacterium]
MAQITVDIGGAAYKLACRDGEEERLRALAVYVDQKAQDLTLTLGQVGETRLLLMSALLVADELFEQRERGGNKRHAVQEEAFMQCLGEATQRITKLAERLEQSPGKT